MPETMIRCPTCWSLHGPLANDYMRHRLEAHDDAGAYARIDDLAFVQVPICPECEEARPDDERVAEGRECGACAYAREWGLEEVPHD